MLPQVAKQPVAETEQAADPSGPCRIVDPRCNDRKRFANVVPVRN